MDKKNIKKIHNNYKKIIAFLVVLSVVISTSTFAYWTSYVEGAEDSNTSVITVGSADAVDTHFTISNDFNSGGYLVPVNQLMNSEVGAVSEINLFYNLEWKETEELTQLNGTTITGDIEISYDLNITIDNEKVSNEIQKIISDLVSVIEHENNPNIMTLGSAPEIFRFKLTLDEPGNLEVYNLLSSIEIRIIISYRIHDKDVVINNND
jgi:predicted ribosomally synthesized peptide with SipW-like signal peptide